MNPIGHWSGLRRSLKAVRCGVRRLLVASVAAFGLAVGVYAASHDLEAKTTTATQMRAADLSAEDSSAEDTAGTRTVNLDDAETIGSWRWRGWSGYWYVFNRWETSAIADWNGSGNAIAIGIIGGVLPPISVGYYSLMGLYKWAAQQARSRGMCLAIAPWSSAAIVSC